MLKLEFVREKRSSLMGYTEVVFTESNTQFEPRPFRLVAHNRGVEIHGESPTLANEWDLQSFAKTMSQAWNDHRELKRGDPVIVMPTEQLDLPIGEPDAH